MKRFRIRSYEMGLLFRDGEFRGLMETGTRWFFDPLGKVRVDVVSKRDPWLIHEKLDLIVKSGALADRAVVLDLKDHERALVWIENRFSHLLPSGLYAYWAEQKNVRAELVDARELDTFLTDKDAVTKSIGTIECRMDIHVRRMANISDINVQATGIAAMDRASGTRPVSISHSGFAHNA